MTALNSWCEAAQWTRCGKLVSRKKTLSRGKRYFDDDHVLRVTSSADTDDQGLLTFQAIVQGSSRTPYVVIMDVDDDGELITVCSCPVGFLCKHAAAALYHVQASHGPRERSLRDTFSPWTRGNTVSSHGSAVTFEGTQSATAHHLNSWIESLEVAPAKAAPAIRSHANIEKLTYLLQLTDSAQERVPELRLCLGRARILSNGSYTSNQMHASFERVLDGQRPRYVMEEDVDLVFRLGALRRAQPHWISHGMPSGISFTGSAASTLLEAIIATQRCFMLGANTSRDPYRNHNKRYVPDTRPFTLGQERHITLTWPRGSDDSFTLLLQVAKPEERKSGTVSDTLLVRLGNQSHWYIDRQSQEIGEATSALSDEVLVMLANAPPIPEHTFPAVAEKLKLLASEEHLNLPRMIQRREVQATLVPSLRLFGGDPYSDIDDFESTALGYTAEGQYEEDDDLRQEERYPSMSLEWKYYLKAEDMVTPELLGGPETSPAQDEQPSQSVAPDHRPHADTFRFERQGLPFLLKRDKERERNALAQMAALGCEMDDTDFRGARALQEPACTLWMKRPEGRNTGKGTGGLTSEQATAAALLRALPSLREAGWEVEVDSTWPLRIIDAEASSLNARFDACEVVSDAEDDDFGDPVNGSEWFAWSLDIEADGKRISLVEPLLEALRNLRGTDVLAGIDAIPESLPLYATTEDGALIALPAARMKPVLRNLYELLQAGVKVDEDGNMRISQYDLTYYQLIQEASEACAKRWVGKAKLNKLATVLSDTTKLPNVSMPKTLNAELRDYQQEGVQWLQFMRANQLGAILADDMGLGKTIQTLAHILIEKRARRLKAPCLVVAPTSLVYNWEEEAKRFAPKLKTLVLQGADRKKHFQHIAQSELVLTSYALLRRDHEELLPNAFHMVIFDEAQALKNPEALTTLRAQTLRANHRVCLSGTPMENRTLDLWSLMHVLMPGFLGPKDVFKKLFQGPIERHGDAEQLRRLSQRVKPFILRRNKDLVAKELPAKTESLMHCELKGAQRTLYETIRVTMDKRVRKAIERKGLSQSKIIVLDALLKLRQVCCDARTLPAEALQKYDKRKTKRAFTDADSCKLVQLMEMLDELVSQGRKVLLFSQFTRMLALIRASLDARHIAYSYLDGGTKDRRAPVKTFQTGDTSVFLISLKAGGTGLNLTAADTVIHFDPWWNPAVEAQATDRAHRIGQDKPIFVHKYIAKGTVEERMVALQEQKKELASALLEGKSTTSFDLSANEIYDLFAPLE